ncbi:MAG: hypothetical protein QMD05_10245, partial [Candidatus Brocadiaceae bacterium]|nr:hypothetical protein [Candidatus Brocadiaceae bacterium]
MKRALFMFTPFIITYLFLATSLPLPAPLAIDIGLQAKERLKGLIKADGSSTVYPITEAVSEEFQKKYPGAKVIVGISGTGG